MRRLQKRRYFFAVIFVMILTMPLFFLNIMEDMEHIIRIALISSLHLKLE